MMSALPPTCSVASPAVSRGLLLAAPSETSESSGGALTLASLAGVVNQISRNMGLLNCNMHAMQSLLASLLPPPPPLVD